MKVLTMSKINLENKTLYPTCFVCGSPETGCYALCIKQNEEMLPYFPFLETHEPPDGAKLPTKCGKIISCYTCYALLTEQWKSYEKNNVPLVKRIYWLKRLDNGPYAGVEIGLQTEYASQVLGISTENLVDKPVAKNNRFDSVLNIRSSLESNKRISKKCRDIKMQKSSTPSLKIGIQEEALDLSMEGPKKKLKVKDANSQVLDLSMPDKDSCTEVCYLCGNQFMKGTLVNIFAKEDGNCLPFFPNLMLHPRPKGSHPMESSGKVSGCESCYNDILIQWKKFEDLHIPHYMRNYLFNKDNFKHQRKNNTCFKCGKLKSRLNQLIIPNKVIESSSIPAQNLPKIIEICDNCAYICQAEFAVNAQLANKCEDILSSSAEKDTKCTFYQNSPISETESHLDLVSCCLCHQSYSLRTMQTLSMIPDPQNSHVMYFSFLKFLPHVNQDMITEDGRILACKACYNHLKSQWHEYENENIPNHQRHFSLRVLPVSSPNSPRMTCASNSGSPPSNSGFSSPGVFQSSPRNTVFTTDCNGNSPTEKSVDKFEANKNDVVIQGRNIKDLEVTENSQDDTHKLTAMTDQKALKISLKCFLCHFISKSGQTYLLSSISEEKENQMYFPFLQKFLSKSTESKIGESHFLVCRMCFHSLLSQWQKYEKLKTEHSLRIYNTYSFTCYVCATKTYRKRLRIIAVKDFPFLKDHPCPSGGMVVNDGASVVVCKDCQLSLNEQYTALERLGVPVDKKQYNWIQRPPPPEFFLKDGCVSFNACTDRRERSSLLPVNPKSDGTGGMYHSDEKLCSSSFTRGWRDPADKMLDIKEEETEAAAILKSPPRSLGEAAPE